MDNNNLDLSLEDIIKRNKKDKAAAKSGGVGGGRRNRNAGGGGGVGEGGGGGGGRGRRRGAPGKVAAGSARRRSDPLRLSTKQGAINKQRQVPARVSDLRENVGISQERKEAVLVISNLDVGVTDSDIKELFVEFGELNRANINYDRNGASLGTAEVVFKVMTDARKAFKQYNGVPLDGKSMDIKFAASQTDVFRTAPPSARSGGFGGNRERRGQGKSRRSGGGGGGAGGRGGGGGGAEARRAGGQRQAGNGRRGGRGGGRGGGGGRSSAINSRPKVTAEDLDKQLEDYATGGDGAINGKSGGGGGGGGGGAGGRRGGRGPKRPTVSAEDLDKQLDNYINKMDED